MKQYSSLAIVSSFLCLWISTLFPEQIEIIIGFILILTFGILHGANDILIFNSINSKKSNISSNLVLLLYIGVVLIGSVLFIVFPSLILILFIVVSSFHFGEQQFTYLDNKSFLKKGYFYCLYGLLLLFLLFTFKSIEVSEVIKDLTSYTIGVNFLFVSFLVFLVLFLGVISFGLYKMQISVESFCNEIFYLIVFSIIFKVSSLVWGFAIYFIIWHSIPSILNQVKFIYGKESVFNIKQYIKSAMLYWILALLSLFVFYWFFKEQKLFNSLFFSFLAAITFPHVLVILLMNKKTK